VEQRFGKRKSGRSKKLTADEVRIIILKNAKHALQNGLSTTDFFAQNLRMYLFTVGVSDEDLPELVYPEELF
jgi:hypothetical protein